jgi:branched-chain amino acid transport system substrate-binding protein
MRTGDFKQTYGELVTLVDSPPVWLWSAVLVAALIGAPFVLNSYALSFLMIILITVVGALGLNILTGYTGLISLGHVGFLVTGAYAYAVLVSKYHLHPLVGFLGAGVVPALASLIVGAPSLRLKGLYLAITTLAFSFIINTAILEARWLTNGARGISVQRPEIFGLSFDSDAAFTYLCLGFAILTLFATLNIRRSRVGRAFVAIRDNDTAARVMGINLHAYKLFAFVTSAFITGLSGALYGIYLSFVSVEGFPFLLSIEALTILIVGGARLRAWRRARHRPDRAAAGSDPDGVQPVQRADGRDVHDRRAGAEEHALRPRHHPVPALPAARPGRRLARHPANVGELAASLLTRKAIEQEEETMIKYLATASLLLAGAYLWTEPSLAADPGITDTEIVIGDVEPLTGPPALLGVAASIGHKIAIAEANNAGGINRRKIKYVLEDDGYVTARTIQGVKKVIDVDKVFAMLGISGSGQSIAVMPILEKAGIPTVIDVAPVKFLWEPPRKNVFVVGQSYEEGIIHLVNYLADKNPGKKWGLITQDDDYGITVRDGFDSVVKAKKLNVVYSGNYKKGQQDFSSDMLQLKDSGAEVFLAGGIIGENIAMMKEIEKLNVKPVVGIFWPGRVEPVLKLMGPAGDGIYAVDYVEPFAGPAGKAFLEKAKGLLPEAEMKGINRYSMTGYAAAKVLIAAIERCGQEPTWACTIAELEKTKNVETGIMAPISFGPGVRFSNQKLQIMQSEFSTLSFKPVN